nr:hypothetical protein [Tanacetum cinerariifolium]
MKVEESLNVTFDETPPLPKTSPLEDDNLVEKEAIEVNKTRPLGNDLEDKSLENNEIINIKESKSHPLDNLIEPKNINEALRDESWKQTALTISTTEAEYVSIGKTCQQALVDYGISINQPSPSSLSSQLVTSSPMTSPHKPMSKPSKVAKMSVRLVWRKKLNYCNTSNEVDVNLPTPMPKPQSPLQEP